MKVRIVLYRGITKILYPDGTYDVGDEAKLRYIFLNFEKMKFLNGKSGRWDKRNIVQIQDVPGKTLAWVDQNNCLCIKQNIFLPMVLQVVDENYIPIKRYAHIHKKSTERVRILCTKQRIVGATKKSGKWFVPVNAEYPNDARRSNLDDELPS